MSYDPLRDTFDLAAESQADIALLAAKIDGQAQSELHTDQCGCDDGVDNCKYGAGALYAAPPEFVIAWMLRAGMVRMEQIRAEVPA